MMKVGASPICLLFCLGLMILASGCATYNVWESNLRYRDYTTEFAQHDRQSFYSRDGVYSGLVNEGGIEWREYLFNEVLDGKGRVFRILIPINVFQGMETTHPDLAYPPEWNGPVVQISETVKQTEASAAAQIVFMPHGAHSVHATMQTLEHHFPALDMTNYGSHMIIMADVFNGNDVVYFRSSDAFGGLTQWVALPTQQAVQWKKRNRFFSFLRKLPYIVTAPLDLLTLPVQLLIGIMILGNC